MVCAWDISRDAYFGFTIPGTTDKYFYVWMDAPIGYMASFQNLCDQDSDLNFDDFWATDSSAGYITLLARTSSTSTPCSGLVLDGSNFRTPTKLHPRFPNRGRHKDV